MSLVASNGSRQQRVHRAGPTVSRPRRHICENGGCFSEHSVHSALEHGAIAAGPQAFAMNDSHTSQVPRERAGQKPMQGSLGLHQRHSMQVDLGLDRVVAPTQPTQHALGHPWAAMGQRLMRADQRFVLGVCDALVEACESLRPADACPADTSPWRGRLGLVAPAVAQRLHLSDGLAEQLDVFGQDDKAGLRSHATSGEGLSVYFRRLIKAPPNAIL